MYKSTGEFYEKILYKNLLNIRLILWHSIVFLFKKGNTIFLLYIYSMIEAFEKTITELQGKYISLKELEELKELHYKQIKNCKDTHLKGQYKNLDKWRETNNQRYLQKEEQESKELLDNVKGYLLDQEQREVVLRDEQSTLVIAGAGSGKSLTMIGKIRYLMERKKIPLDQILCISFTNDATNSLKNVLKKYYNYDLPVLTFHKLALQIIRKNSGELQIADDKVLENVVKNYLKYGILEEKDAKKWIYRHFFHRLRQSKRENVNRMQSFPQVYQKMQNTALFKQYYKIIPTFIHLMKANQFHIEDIDVWIHKSKRFGIWKTVDTYLLLLIKRICILYTQTLKNSNLLDFDDLIEYATTLVKNDNTLHYEYIIIDEYQDTSETRYQLIQAIIQKTRAKLIAVGDDFQSIYRFTGCNLNIFLKFQTYFKNAIVLKIQTTYRNSQELINIAGSFVMRNPRQMSKNLVSHKHIEKPVIIKYYQDLLPALKQILDSLQNVSIFLLGRNRKDIAPILQDDVFKSEDGRNITYQNRSDLVLTFLTVHTSKGLESDVVIVLNMTDTTMGFPSQLEDDPVLRYVNQTKDYFPFEEERRLFYVAITRTKNKVYLMTQKKNPSIFVKELIQRYKNQIKIE